MNFKNIFYAILSLIFSSQVALAVTGTESGGGGDPQAVDFLLKVRVVAEWVKVGGAAIDEDEKQRIFVMAQKLSALMDDASKTPIVMVTKSLYDASGASKVALYNLPDFKIEVTRSKWKNLKEEDKYVTAGLELFGLAQVQERYKIAGLLQNNIQSAMQLSGIVGAKQDIQDPKSNYFALVDVFPEFQESIGGFSKEINLKSLQCSSATSTGASPVETYCVATDLNGQTFTRVATNLFLTLVANKAAALNFYGEPGMVYFDLEEINCGVLEPRISDPSIPVEPEYYCSGKIIPPQESDY